MARLRENKPNLGIIYGKSDKSDKSDREKTSKKKKRRKSRARSPSLGQKKKAKKRARHRKRRCCYFSSEYSTTSSSDTSSSESGESEDGKLAKTEKFHVVAQEDINKYDFSAELAEYANEYCNKFIPKKDIERIHFICYHLLMQLNVYIIYVIFK